VERAGVTGVAAGVVDNLKSQPAMLVILVLNVLMIGALLWCISQVAQGRTEMINKLIERCAGS
jgi:hypothetical protein